MANLRRVLRWCCVGVLLGAGGCGTARYGGTAAEDATPEYKIAVEAWLFDARIKRDGKPTSFRLEIYQTDSVSALAGRGYLGKGALKGRMTGDSVEIYFPSTNEYLYEPVAEVLNSSVCSEKTPTLDFQRLLRDFPDTLKSDGLRVESDFEDENAPHFVLEWEDCPWRMELIYDRRDNGWRLRELIFDDGDLTTFTARRRTYKDRANVSSNKFRVQPPPDAVRVSL